MNCFALARLALAGFSLPKQRLLSCATSVSRRRVARLSGITIILTLLAACADPPPLLPPTPLSSINRVVTPASEWRIKIGDSSDKRRGQFTPYHDSSGVYAAAVNGRVVSVNAETGKRRWRRDLQVRLGSGVGGDAKRIYVATRNGEVLALSKSTGDTLWSYEMASEVLARPVATAAIGTETSGLVVVRASNGDIRGLNPDSGEEIWSANFETPALTIQGYGEPVVLDSGVLIGLEDGKLAALSRDRGVLLWESVISHPAGRSEVDRLVDIDANILLDETSIYAVTFQGRLASIEPRRGDLLWSTEMSSVSGMAQDATTLYITLDDSSVVAVSKQDGEQIWKQEKLRGRELTRPAVVGEGLIAVADFRGFMHILKAGDGDIIGRAQPLGSRSSSPAITVTTVENSRSTEEGDEEAAPSKKVGLIYLQSSSSELVAMRVR